MAEEEKIFYFKEGLKERTKKEIICRGINRVSEAIPLAIQLETVMSNVSKINFVKSNKTYKNYPKKSNNNYHKSQQQALGKDHNISNKTKIGKDKNNYSQKNNKFKESVICSRCRPKKLNTEPSAQNKNESFVGAPHSVMNHMTAVLNNFKIFMSNNSIKTASGTISKISGRTKSLEVDIRGNKSMIEFIVFDHEDHDILFGMDWFHQTKSGNFPLKE
ncbi:unnamed protein product [Brachionus calyciflorus]|uniref:Uncharacterized protein n=1 Tax=Brachionus calyciflorus TaxID=104777 RepID=A0A814G2G3_9BILA|nr:unnamed protein product [Brachionus calyciflorus]